MRIRFGPFEFDRQSRLLWREGTEIALPPRVLGVLDLLTDRAGQVVSRQDLLDGVWKDAFVTDTSLAEAVSYLRQSLGDDPQAPRYIQTVHRRGYRFIAPLSEVAPQKGAIPGSGPDLTRVWAGPDPGMGGARLGPDPGQAPVWVRPGTGLVPGGENSARANVDEPSKWWELSPLLVVLLCIAIGTIGVWRMSKIVPEPPPIARFVIASEGGTFDSHAPALAVSPDGRILVWAGCNADGACALYRRSLDGLETTRIADTDGAMQPFFSADGRWIGFFADGKLKKIATGGGTASLLADAPSPAGGSWNANGQIVFAGSAAGGLSLVNDEGGTVSALTTPKVDHGEVRHRFPAWLPSGGVVFTIATSPLPDMPGELAAIAAQGRDRIVLRAGVIRAAVAAPGYLLMSTGGDLQAATFDDRSLTLTGGSDSVVSTIGNRPVTDFATGGGTLLATPAPVLRSFAWDDGADAGDTTALARMTWFVFSPDSRHAAGVVADAASSDVWTVDLRSGAASRTTYGGMNVSPAWSPDGTRLVFATRGAGPYTLASRSLAERAITPIQTDAPSHVFPGSVAPDGRIAVTAHTSDGRTAIGLVPADGGHLQLLAAGPFDESNPAFSPDGRSLALQSWESGRSEIIVSDMKTGTRTAVTTSGGASPRWSADGRSIYFDARDRLMRAPFNPADGSAGRAEMMPGPRAAAITPSARVLLPNDNLPSDRAFVVLQWLRELRQRLPMPTTTPR